MKINVLTRTHDRKEYFEVSRNSILEQTYKNINHIVGSDVECDYLDDIDVIKLTLKPVDPKPDGLASYPAPWNAHCNELNKHVKDGWIMYLDDDDKFVTPNAVQIIVDNIEHENQIVMWRVDINGLIVPREAILKDVRPGNISAIGFLFHSKYLPVDWGSWNFGDYRVITQLLNKGLEKKWISRVLTQTQGNPNFGQIPIKLI